MSINDAAPVPPRPVPRAAALVRRVGELLRRRFRPERALDRDEVRRVIELDRELRIRSAELDRSLAWARLYRGW